MNGIIIYKGKYGATEQYANWLSKELQLPVMKPGRWGDKELNDCDYIILGSSVYIGTLQIKHWLISHSAQLINKRIFLFVVSGTSSHETEKLEGYVRKSVPASILGKCSIFYLPGRLLFNRLSIIDKFMLRAGARIEKDEVAKKRMMADYDEVKKEHLNGLIREVKKITGT